MAEIKQERKKYLGWLFTGIAGVAVLFILNRQEEPGIVPPSDISKAPNRNVEASQPFASSSVDKSASQPGIRPMAEHSPVELGNAGSESKEESYQRYCEAQEKEVKHNSENEVEEITQAISLSADQKERLLRAKRLEAQLSASLLRYEEKAVSLFGKIESVEEIVGQEKANQLKNALLEESSEEEFASVDKQVAFLAREFGFSKKQQAMLRSVLLDPDLEDLADRAGNTPFLFDSQAKHYDRFYSQALEQAGQLSQADLLCRAYHEQLLYEAKQDAQDEVEGLNITSEQYARLVNTALRRRQCSLRDLDDNECEAKVGKIETLGDIIGEQAVEELEQKQGDEGEKEINKHRENRAVFIARQLKMPPAEEEKVAQALKDPNFGDYVEAFYLKDLLKLSPEQEIKVRQAFLDWNAHQDELLKKEDEVSPDEGEDSSEIDLDLAKRQWVEDKFKHILSPNQFAESRAYLDRVLGTEADESEAEH